MTTYNVRTFATDAILCELSRKRRVGISVVTTYVNAAHPILKPTVNKESIATMADF